MFIYLITNDVNDKSYVGFHLDGDLRERWSMHIRDCGRGRPTALYNAIRKYGAEKFHIVSVWSGHIPIPNLKVLEKFFIRSFQTKAPLGYNLTDGGDGFVGGQHRKESREQTSLSCMGQRNSLGCKRSSEFKRKVSLYQSGRKRRPFTLEERRKISEVQQGRKNSEESKKKVSESLKRAYAEGRRKSSRIAVAVPCPTP
jgi:group I intron endonuclease